MLFEIAEIRRSLLKLLFIWGLGLPVRSHGNLLSGNYIEVRGFPLSLDRAQKNEHAATRAERDDLAPQLRSASETIAE